MLSFAAEVSKNETIHQLSPGAMAADKLADLYINVCGDSLDEHGQNLVKVLAENKRLTALPEISALFDLLKADYEKEVELNKVKKTLNPFFIKKILISVLYGTISFRICLWLQPEFEKIKQAINKLLEDSLT